MSKIVMCHCSKSVGVSVLQVSYTSAGTTTRLRNNTVGYCEITRKNPNCLATAFTAKRH